jgi:hypothetical protein
VFSAGTTADYNHNGTVDAADYNVWRNTLNLTQPLDADGNSNGIIDDGDYNVWRMNFGTVVGAGTGTSTAAALVPEPGGLLLLAIGTALAFRGLRLSASPKIRARRGRRGEQPTESSPA